MKTNSYSLLSFTNAESQAIRKNLNDFRYGSKQKGGPENRNIKFFIGALLVVLLIAQYIYPLEISELTALQTDNTYKQITGFSILALVLLQWRLTHLRNTKQANKLRNAFSSHQSVGIWFPVLIFAHTSEPGYGIQMALLASFIALIVVGLLHGQNFKIRNKWYANTWIVVHISLATVVMTLMFYHIYVTYSYS